MDMLKDKKGVELTFNAIIIAALVLIVLVVVVLILTGMFSDIVPQLHGFTSCPGQGGECRDTCEKDERGVYKLGDCGKDGGDHPNQPWCCIPKGQGE